MTARVYEVGGGFVRATERPKGGKLSREEIQAELRRTVTELRESPARRFSVVQKAIAALEPLIDPDPPLPPAVAQGKRRAS